MAKGKRSFSPDNLPEKQEDYHGGCRIARISPDVGSKGVQSVNLTLTFDESLRLATAIQSAVMKLNRYNRSSKAGREMGLCLSLKVDTAALSVIETKVIPPRPNVDGK